MDALTQSKFAQGQPVGTKGIGLDHIRTCHQKRPVYLFHRLRICDHKVIITAHGGFAAKMFGGQVLAIQVGAHCAIEQHNPRIKGVQVFSVGEILLVFIHSIAFRCRCELHNLKKRPLRS